MSTVEYLECEAKPFGIATTTSFICVMAICASGQTDFSVFSGGWPS